METCLISHKQLMENLRKKCGEHNYVTILDSLKLLYEVEPDEDRRYLLECSIKLYETLVELEEIKKDADVQATLEGKVTTGNATNNEAKDKKQYITIERDGRELFVKNTLKSRTICAAINHCLFVGKPMSLLGVKDFADIAMVVNSDGAEIKSILYRARKDKGRGLTIGEKQFYISYVANKGKSGCIHEMFDFFEYNSNEIESKKRKTA